MTDDSLEIERILASYDPEKLISGGAPSDEYRYEAKEIAMTYPFGGSWEDISRLIGDVFHRNFDFAYTLSDKPSGLLWCKHALNHATIPPGVTLNLASEKEVDPERSNVLEQAAKEIHSRLGSRLSSG